MSRSKVSSTLTDFDSRSEETGRSSSARARRCSERPCAQHVHQLGLRDAADVTDGADPRRVSRSAWPGLHPTGLAREGMQNEFVPGSTTTRPSGLACSEAIFASSLTWPHRRWR